MAINVILGTDNDDILHGGNKQDHILAGLGNDLLLGGNKEDTLEGEDGNDTLFGFVTSECSSEVKKEAEDAGAKFFIVKPFTPNSFEAALAPVLAN